MRIRGLLWEKIRDMKIKKKIPKIYIRSSKHIPRIEKFKNIESVDIKYEIIEDFAYAHIKWSGDRKEIVYNIIEPELKKKEKEILNKIKNDLIELIDVELSKIKRADGFTEYLHENIEKIIKEEGIKVSRESFKKIFYYIYRDFVGLNEIEALIHDEFIEDIGCDGINIPIFVVHRIFGSIPTNIVYTDIDNLNNFVIKLAERCGRYISYANPLLDGTLPDGSRVQATLAKDVTTRGPTFSIRKFRKKPFSPIEIIKLNTASFDVLAYLWMVIESRASILICGGVSSGKTTFLNVLSMFIRPEEKIVSIEDTRELNLPHENWIPSVARTGFGIGGKSYGEVTLFELLKESFRQNPDYVIVGEVRGKEAYVMFQGIASGHASISTMHAGSVDDVIKRLQTPPIELSPGLVETLDIAIVMIHAKERGKDARRVKEIVEIINVDEKSGTAKIFRPFVWDPVKDTFKCNIQNSHFLRKISKEQGIKFDELLKEIKNRVEFLKWLKRNNIEKFSDVCKYINLYYKDKKEVMKLVKKRESAKKIEKKAKKIWKSASGLIVIEK